ncbi:acyltransferase [Micromonospora sp. RHAY321]|uniref:acyltransferase family protein n=1 Tax=Micromonospora sp. RHAY321 TaxID=2944807 RepID=UPI00207CD32F|nr:acyltransferase [Micromonospora sp. RHAY321]MCO1599553.1 acyltransferase [Micromonospora sp. RHAY321]
MRSLRYDEFQAMRRFPALDGLRAVAAIMVFAFHYGGPSWKWLTGWIGVHLFFVLSGFLITTLLLREEHRYGRVSLRAFYLRRFFRIMPVYLLVLFLTWGLARLSGSAETIERLMKYYLLFINELLPGTAPYLHSWTIGIEQKFYLFWPAIAFVLVTAAFRRRLAVTAGLIVLFIAMIPPDIAWLSWPIHYVAILLGCLTAVVMHHRRGFALVRPLTHPVTATAVIVVFVAFQVAVQYWPIRFGQEALIGTYAAAAALLLPALLSRSVLARGLGLRPLVFIGERSYSMYLVQSIAARVAIGLLPAMGRRSTAVFLGAVVVALVVADVLYRWVELPMIEVGRRLAARVTRRGPRDGDSTGQAGPTGDADAVRPVELIPRPREVLADTVPAGRG